MIPVLASLPAWYEDVVNVVGATLVIVVTTYLAIDRAKKAGFDGGLVGIVSFAAMTCIMIAVNSALS